MESDNFLSINIKQGLSRQESDSEAHSSVLGHVQHFPFNVVLFSLKSTAAIHFAQVHLNKRNLEEGRQTTAQIDRRSRHEVNIWNSFSATAY